MTSPTRDELARLTYIIALRAGRFLERQALIERELRQALQRENIKSLPLYPEDRHTQRPTAEQIIRLFSLTQCHVLELQGQRVRTFEPQLTALQLQVLKLLGVTISAYQRKPQ